MCALIGRLIEPGRLSRFPLRCDHHTLFTAVRVVAKVRLCAHSLISGPQVPRTYILEQCALNPHWCGRQIYSGRLGLCFGLIDEFQQPSQGAIFTAYAADLLAARPTAMSSMSSLEKSDFKLLLHGMHGRMSWQFLYCDPTPRRHC